MRWTQEQYAEFVARRVMSDKKLKSSLENLKKANASNARRPSKAMAKRCEQCGGEFKVKPCQFDLKTYCSKKCMAEHYRTRMAGSENPNFKGLSGKYCIGCGKRFESYNKDRKYCSFVCYASLTQNKISNFGRSGIDQNQDEIVEALRGFGASVIVTAELGGGFPDLVIGYDGETFLLEVKNPNNTYGRKGFSKSQQKFYDNWNGSKPVIVTNVKEALAAVGAVMQ